MGEQKDLDVLYFELSDKEEELKTISPNTFIYDPRIEEITEEIHELQIEIDKLEKEKENNE